MSGLDCDHCCGIAIDSADDRYDESMRGPCASCGYPGRVSVEEDEDGPYATWRISEAPGSVCDVGSCFECTRARTKP